jgi:hypothetical protein
MSHTVDETDHQIPYPLQSSSMFADAEYKQVLVRNSTQQDMFLVSLLTETRLKEKEGTQRTLVNVRVEEIFTVPI